MPSSQIIGISRSISACKRCRRKKIKCSHDFPRCTACARANVECVSLDPATGREITRSYVVALEQEVESLKKKLQEASSGIGINNNKQHLTDSTSASTSTSTSTSTAASHIPISSAINSYPCLSSTTHESSKTSSTEFKKTISPSESSSTILQGSSPTDSFTHSGVTFSKLMTTALHFKANRRESQYIQLDDNDGEVKSTAKLNMDPTTLSDSLSSSLVALLPPKQQALNFISLYFEQSNSQLPVFHRESFLRDYFQPIYGDVPTDISFASDYTSINNEFFKHIPDEDTWYYQYTQLFDAEFDKDPEMDVLKFSASVQVPQLFRKAMYFLNIVFAISSSIWHLQFPNEISDNFKNAAFRYIDDVYTHSSKLEALQAMLALSIYSVMRPCSPGVWYLLGTTLRICVDLGLHKEENSNSYTPFVCDMRRRIFWSCYSLDRQICVYLNRPFGIPEESITTPFPSSLDDALITSDFVNKNDNINHSSISSYKNISIAMFKIRKLQAEIQSILFEGKEIPRKFPSFDSWFVDISRRLKIWSNQTPKTQRKMNCNFNAEFFDLNYFHANVMLHGLSPVRYSLTNNDMIQLAESSIGMIIAFHSLWSRKALNHTWSVTQNAFMASTSYLYAIFNNKQLRQQTHPNEILKLSELTEIVLSSLVDRCDAASECLEVFKILSRAIIKLLYPDFIHSEISTSEEVKKIPSEIELKNFQPGGYLTGNMRRLMLSVPYLINSNNLNSNTQKANDEPTHKRKNSADLEIPFKKFKNNISSLVSPSEDGIDLIQFFEEVNKVDSPNSTRSWAETSTVDAQFNDQNGENNFEKGNQNQKLLGKEKKKRGEGKRVYKMITQTGADSIWDQYFAKSLGVDDLI